MSARGIEFHIFFNALQIITPFAKASVLTEKHMGAARLAVYT